MAKIKFYVECFDRYITFDVNDKDKYKAEHIIEKAYEDWIEDDMGYCCEEYLCECLKESGIEFTYKYEMTNENRLSFLEQLLCEEECCSSGYINGSDEAEENRAKIEALKWAIEICKQNCD